MTFLAGLIQYGVWDEVWKIFWWIFFFVGNVRVVFGVGFVDEGVRDALAGEGADGKRVVEEGW